MPTHNNLSGGVVSGISAGAVVGLILVVVIIYLCRRNSVYRKWYKSEKRSQVGTESWSTRRHNDNQAQWTKAPSYIGKSEATPTSHYVGVFLYHRHCRP